MLLKISGIAEVIDLITSAGFGFAAGAAEMLITEAIEMVEV